MIGPEQVRQWAEACWPDYLRALIDGRNYFPLRRDRLGRAAASLDARQFAETVAPLWDGSKQVKGSGYTVVLEPRNRRSRQLQNEPVAVVFETEDDYLQFLKRGAAAIGFKSDWALLHAELPRAKAALRSRPDLIVTQQGSWPGILEVVRYLQDHPRPGCHVRALPVKVPTKFIETRREVIELLVAALPECGYYPNGETFAQRCGFAEDEPAIRGRFLCPDLRARLGFAASDLMLRVGAWAVLPMPAELRVVVCENKTNFLALPPMTNVLALFGEGGAVSGHLPRLGWLRQANLIYWGDLDPCGFAILARLRAHLPSTRSILMDGPTLDGQVDHLRAANPAPGGIGLAGLTADERVAAERVDQLQQGVEQERLLFADCFSRLRAAFDRGS